MKNNFLTWQVKSAAELSPVDAGVKLEPVPVGSAAVKPCLHNEIIGCTASFSFLAKNKQAKKKLVQYKYLSLNVCHAFKRKGNVGYISSEKTRLV